MLYVNRLESWCLNGGCQTGMDAVIFLIICTYVLYYINLGHYVMFLMTSYLRSISIIPLHFAPWITHLHSAPWILMIEYMSTPE